MLAGKFIQILTQFVGCASQRLELFIQGVRVVLAIITITVLVVTFARICLLNRAERGVQGVHLVGESLGILRQRGGRVLQVGFLDNLVPSTCLVVQALVHSLPVTFGCLELVGSKSMRCRDYGGAALVSVVPVLVIVRGVLVLTVLIVLAVLAILSRVVLRGYLRTALAILIVLTILVVIGGVLVIILMTLVLVVLVTVVPVLVIVRGVLIALVLVILIALRSSRGLTARRRSQVGAQTVYFLLRELAAVFYRELAEFVSDIFVLLVYRVRVSAHVVARRHGLTVQAVERLGELIRGFLELIYRPAARLERFRDVTVLLVVSNGFLTFIALQVLRQVVYLAAQGTVVLVGTLEVLRLQLVHKLLTISDEANQACL